MRRWLRLALLSLLALLALIIALPFALDTQPGRDWAARRLGGFSLANGLSLHVTRISGSLWDKATLEGVELHDQHGRFARAPRVALDWSPRALIGNRFEATELIIPDATLERLPRLKPVADPRILPDIDISIDRLELGRLVVTKGIAGPQRLLRAKSRLDLHAGRALVDLDTAVAAGDTLALHLDAEPDRDTFALDARLAAPAGGLVTTLARLQAPLNATATGRGRWRDWTGQLVARLGTTPLANLALSGKAGALSARGRIDPLPLLGGAANDALAGGLAVVAQLVPDGDLIRLKLTADGRHFTGRLNGRIDRAEERWTDAEARLALADGSALARSWGVDGGLLNARLAGPLLAPLVDARLLAKRLALPGGLALNGLSVAGIADLNETGLSVPLVAVATGLVGLPENLAPLTGKWRAEGRLLYARGQLQTNDLKLTSGPLAARIGLSFVPATSAWGLNATGDVRGWALPQLGLADASFRANLKPGANQSIAGNGEFRLIAARPPASGLTRLTGGGLTLGGRFALLPGLAVTLSELALSSPKLAAAGRAGWANGRFTLAATGRSLDWGPFALDGEGTAAAPHFTARLAKPGYGLTAVAARIDPAGDGWRVEGDAQSGLGPVTLKADITLSPVLRIDVDRLAAADLVASGRLDQSAAGPFAGTLALAGKGLTGSAKLSAAGDVQLAELALAGDMLNLPLATPITVDRLRLAARVLLPASGPDIDAALDLAGLERGSLVVEKAVGALHMEGGSGTASLALAGNSGEAFNLAFSGTIAPDRWQISGGGEYDGRGAKLAGPAVITRDAAGWHLAPVTLTSALGNAELAGDWGETKRLNARLDKVSLQMVGLAYPSLNLAGRVSGTLALAQAGDAAPTGTAALRLNGLSRSNITSTSTPIDVGLNAALGAGGTVMRAVIVRAGKVEGRAQARLGPIPAGEADLVSRLFDASVTGQLRYAGPAQDLWGLSGLTALDVRGAVQVAADVSGTLGDPQVAGQIRGTGGRVEAPLLGAVATDVSLDARFTASKLELTRFAGKSGQGSITGSGAIDLSYERAFPMDIRMVATNAAILGRDDVSATGSGNIRVATDEYGGVVSGALTLSRADYRVGRTAVADVPVLQVTEKNTRVLGRRTLQYVAPTRWLFNLAIKADRRLLVTGMGINSEWQADVRLRGGATTPELFGRVQLVRGDYDFAGKRFQLTRGDIRFVGGYPPDPIIAVTAENTGNGFTAFLTVEGTAQRPQIKFSSVPALPEDEVLSRVLFGSRVTDLSAPEAIQLAGALTSLRGGGFNPIGAVGKGLGIDRLRILPADVVTGRRTTVAAGQYVGRNVYVELATDAQGYTATSIEIGLTRTLSVLSQVATLGGTSASVRWKKDY
ncbi:translocation/assembly module TamB domain-containing protein [Sandarakinorhabdus sp. AAP62]|uniref:translocation/assembly module TamB domain-containing protein n=1 Tax=Sandarakinorhabdus sp. AAP62 TaxID=1248916 RepID=UPI0002E1BAE6|nr:translocation/assembly module TamB domain-containing protein [Sandarakinorhabdus sp. AAP62]